VLWAYKMLEKIIYIYIYIILCCLHFFVNFVIKEKDLFVGNNWIFDNWFMKISTLKTKWNFFLKLLKPCLIILKTRIFFFFKKDQCNFYKLFKKPDLMVVNKKWESSNIGWNIEFFFCLCEDNDPKKRLKKNGS